MASGSLITNSDLSSLRDKMNTILNGTGVHGGYNQSHTMTHYIVRQQRLVIIITSQIHLRQ
jgi:hypothetical protein